MYFDPHVHLRDRNQRYKETILHGLRVARDSGVDVVIDMPNTDPPVTTRSEAIARIYLALLPRDTRNVFYSLFMGLTKDPEQVKRAIGVYRELFPRVAGMKFYAGHSVGNLGVVESEDQARVYETLAREGYDGVFVIHAEKESLLKPDLWMPENPVTHCNARPEEAEVQSIKDQLELAVETGFRGKLHISHISSPVSVDIVTDAKKIGVDISCGVCPHHFIYNSDQMERSDGNLWKMNPPLRSRKSQEKLPEYLRQGKIDWIETDHAPHTLDEKTGPPYASGIPGLAWWPLFEEYLRRNDFTDRQIEELTFNNAARRFNLPVERKRRKLVDRRKDYPFDPYKEIAEQLGWAA
ncbi:MAG: dihydroorotase [Candidatus Aenigmarchaeota archaeon]|nr:dihydroorotase [Candidatus Aenigmarchaeota archaeon]